MRCLFNVSTFPTPDQAQLLHKHFPDDNWDTWQQGQPFPDGLSADDVLFLLRVLTTPDKPYQQLSKQRTEHLQGIEREYKQATKRCWNLRYRLKSLIDPQKRSECQRKLDQLIDYITNGLEPRYRQFKKDALTAYRNHLDYSSQSSSACHPDEIPFAGQNYEG